MKLATERSIKDLKNESPSPFSSLEAEAISLFLSRYYDFPIELISEAIENGKAKKETKELLGIRQKRNRGEESYFFVDENNLKAFRKLVEKDHDQNYERDMAIYRSEKKRLDALKK